MSVPRIHFDGGDWVPAEHYDAAMAKLTEKQRTTADHNHQFAAINNLFANLTQDHAGAPYAASADAFRKHALIQTGHCDVETVALSSHEDAKAIAPLVSAKAKKAHGYAITIVRGPLLICSTPHSQSFKAMGRERFQKSKADCLEWASALLGVEA